MNTPPIPPSNATHTNNPHNNDVLCGRGGTINAHPGNEQYRKFVDRKKRVYLTARFKREKRLIAQSIVEEIRNLEEESEAATCAAEAQYDFQREEALVAQMEARDEVSNNDWRSSYLDREKGLMVVGDIWESLIAC